MDHAGRSTTLPINTPSSLMFYLASRGDWVSRSELAYLYRPDESESNALAYLRLQVHRVQGQPWCETFEVEPKRLRWQISTDLAALRAAEASEQWSEVIGLYSGPLLSGVDLSDKPTYNAWLELERGSYQQTYVTALRQEAGRLEASHDYRQSAGLYLRLAELDEFDEWATSGLVRALALAGDREQALRRYDEFTARLRTELGVEPTTQFEELGASIRSGATRPLESARPRREPTPLPTTRFVGRHTELAELRALLGRQDCRLVTVVGMGGTGKTRIALELRRSAAGLAQALRVEASGQQEVMKAVIDHLEGRNMLLVLDNLEHLPEFSPFIAAVLTASTRLKVLATSRVSLRLQGEWLFDLPGLAFPRPGEPVTEVGFAAVELFVSAARRVAPRLTFSEEDLAHVATICRQVDGLPLALELAAAWVRAVPVARIATEIGAGSDMLRSDAFDLPERHRSVTAVLDRTWAEITGPKASALKRLSVFRGGLSLEAGEAVVGVGLPILLSLVNESLVNRDATGRLGSHPLVAQYARKRLEEDPAALDEVLDKHADYYVELLRHYDPERRAARVRSHRGRSPGSGSAAAGTAEAAAGESYRDLEPDLANIELAWFRLLATGRHEAMAEVAESVLSVFNTLGHYQRGTALAADTVAALADSTDNPNSDNPNAKDPSNAEDPSTAVDSTTASAVAGKLKCTLLLALATNSREAGRLKESADQSESALALAERWGLHALIGKSLRYRGDAEQMLGRFEEARASYLAATELLEAREEVTELANTLNSLASMDAMRENFEQATAGFERCVELFEASGDELAKAIALNNLGYIADCQGKTSAASRYYEAGLAGFEHIKFVRGIAAAKNNLVVLYSKLGRLDEAETMGLESLAMKERANDRLGTIITLKNLGDVDLLRGRPHAAIRLLESALRTAVETDAVPRLLQVLPSYAHALQGVDRHDLAERVLTAVVAHPLTTPSLHKKALDLAPSHLQCEGALDESVLAKLIPELPFAY